MSNLDISDLKSRNLHTIIARRSTVALAMGSENMSLEDSPFPLTDIDKWVLSQTDEEFQVHTWAELKDIIANNRLQILKRRPSDLRRYMSWSREINAQYGSMTKYLIQSKLPWGSPPFTYKSPIPFEDAADYQILVNDWPYAFPSDLTHIVVWSKTPIATDEQRGDVTEESRRIIEAFVQKTFVERLGDDRVLWFKNWVSLQSVRALEHVHVLVRGAQKGDLEFWTGTNR